MKINKLPSGLFAVLLASLTFTAQPVQAVKPNLKYEEITLPQPGETQSTAAKRVTARLTQSHYSKFTLDQAFLEKVFTRYLNFLDYNHNTFLQSDVDQLRAQAANGLQQSLYSGELGLAYTAYELMTKRRYERYAYLLSLLDKEPDLSADDQIEIDRSKMTTWPSDSAELDKLWLQRFKNDVITERLKGTKWSDIKKKLTKRYNLAILRLNQTRADDISQLFLNAFAREIDPHTSYLSPRNAKSFTEDMNLSLEGIGATLQSEDDETTIKSLVPGAPAERSKKLAAGDKIVGVGQGAKGEIEDVVGWRLDDVVDKIKGKKGTTVRLEIEPAKGGKTKIISLVRDQVRIEDNAAKLEVNQVDGKTIGVIKIPSFYIGLSDDVRKLLDQAKEKNTQALIIDLRENGGGALTEAVALSGLFISDGPVVQVRDAYNRIRIHQDPDSAQVYQGPLLVMINRYSASASEIFAAAIQDYQRGIILGQQTFGKGTVQQSRPLNFVYDMDQSPLGFIQYTIQKFYRINGGSTQIKGVEPDITFPAIIDAEKSGESSEDNALPWDKVPAANYTVMPSQQAAISYLTPLHQKRMTEEREFIVLERNLQIQKAWADRKFLSLNLKQRQQENREDEQRRLKDLNERFKAEGKKPLKNIDDLPKDYEAPDFYIREAEKVAADYVTFLNGRH
ncbi:C-terminal processing peptidase-1. Serine peptidase. MEROPS family S41A [Pasteurella testudinis DSM 23072]|uniref:C-terminal processing peptidase-1. Serine peptidase. MEROPS family S41A n=1 Tax=Pasteurella testudinis DSM 23072 TaxID=1122938 RepID=A0A1W1VAM8_9PAST|nr:carboxy terminal-processing peptidase [Pasteurella testudinis]SMB90101.1 C-terminal processing peptidase-1. Serine peptidase. MEROPS family S41A [Pasteurella testudinis DSM 23072]SUB51332.1 tail-specific protease [Pasteurella testudinis]